MTVRKTFILKAEQGFLDGGYILKFRSPNLYTIIIVTKIKKGFLKKKERVKGDYAIIQAS